MSLPPQRLVELVIVTLATYQFSLERAWALREPLIDAGLCDPDRVLALSVGDLGLALKDAGYDRGGVTWIIAPRLHSLMAAHQAGELDGLVDRLAADDEPGFRAAIESVKGFGPKASWIAWELMRSPPSTDSAS